MCDRFFNLSPRICIYDLDGTVIDSSHRATHDKDGNIDLVNWVENSTKDLIYQDKLMPLYTQLVADYKNGDMVIYVLREISEYMIGNIYTLWVFITIGLYQDLITA